MTATKIVRSLCIFTREPTEVIARRLGERARRLTESGFVVQTKRLCAAEKNMQVVEKTVGAITDYQSVGSLTLNQLQEQLPCFLATKNVACNIDLTTESLALEHVHPLFEIIRKNPAKTFNFTYVFHNAVSSPYFPSATYERDGFAVGLQPTDLSEGCTTLQEWCERMRRVWAEIIELFKNEPDFLGIDSSIAPLFAGQSSLINLMKRLGHTFPRSTTTDLYLRLSRFIKEENPKPVGLCGLMFPCLEDFELANEYECGEFSIERNVYLSLHSGLGIDTYPIGLDEDPERVREILKLLQGLAEKHRKPLSARFVSDGRAHIGQRTNFGNQYLKDATVRKL